MLLTIDFGNTTIALAVFDGPNIRHRWFFDSDLKRLMSFLGREIEQSLAKADICLSDITGVAVANVVPAADETLRAFASRFTSFVHLSDATVRRRIPVQVDKPQDVGDDRLANATALRYHGRLPAVAIDFGTATTFDIVDQHGTYQGGAIAPGIALALQTLHDKTAKLPRVLMAQTTSVIGKSTLQAIQGGMFWGYQGLINGIIGRIVDELQSRVYIVATGGFGSLFTEAVECINDSDPDLTFKGLMYLYHDCQD